MFDSRQETIHNILLQGIRDFINKEKIILHERPEETNAIMFKDFKEGKQIELYWNHEEPTIYLWTSDPSLNGVFDLFTEYNNTPAYEEDNWTGYEYEPLDFIAYFEMEGDPEKIVDTGMELF